MPGGLPSISIPSQAVGDVQRRAPQPDEAEPQGDLRPRLLWHDPEAHAWAQALESRAADAAEPVAVRIRSASVGLEERQEALQAWQSSIVVLSEPDLHPARIVPAVVQAARAYQTYIASHQLASAEPETIEGWTQLRGIVAQLLVPRAVALADMNELPMEALENALTHLEAGDATPLPRGDRELLRAGRIPLAALKCSQLCELGSALATLRFAQSVLAVRRELQLMNEDYSAAMQLYREVDLKQMSEKQFSRIRVASKRAQFSHLPEKSVDAEEDARLAGELRRRREVFISAAGTAETSIDAAISAARTLSSYRLMAEARRTPADAEVERVIGELQAKLTGLWQAGTLALQQMKDWKLKVLASAAAGDLRGAVEAERTRLLQEHLATKSLIDQDAGLRGMNDAQLQAALDICKRKGDLATKLDIQREIGVRNRLQTLAAKFVDDAAAASFDGEDAAAFVQNVATAAESFAIYCGYADENDLQRSATVESALVSLASSIGTMFRSVALTVPHLDQLAQHCDALEASDLAARLRTESEGLRQDAETGSYVLRRIGLTNIDDDSLLKFEAVFARFEETPLLRGIRAEIEKRWPKN